MGTYLYLEPVTKSKTAITGALLLIIITALIINYIHIYLNWGNKTVKCKAENIYIAYIMGIMDHWKKTCVK
jgi:hypothetical protein